MDAGAIIKSIRPRSLLSTVAVLCAVSLSPIALPAQDTKPTPVIGSIDYFGYDGINLQAVKNHLPIHVGDSFSEEQVDRDNAVIQKAVQRETGRPATDVDIVCCYKGNNPMIFVGLAGASSRPLAIILAPHGSDRLDPTALQLNKAWEDTFEQAMQRGASREDDSQGYSLSVDPELRAVQLKMRAYALDHEAELERVLRSSAEVEQRRISAEFLGYTKRSPTQIKALTDAVTDSDQNVRNNALRALWVLSSAKNAEPLKIDPNPFIAYLFSGTWSDRNKASLLLANLTKQRDPELLKKLHTDAIKPLLEGAQWSSIGHASPFLMILGRIGGLPDDQIEALMAAGDRQKIIQAARSR